MTTATDVKERPVLFSGPMVRAILAGRKTQTRRIIKPQPPSYIDELHDHALSRRAPYRLEHPETGCDCGFGFEDDDNRHYRCPYGIPGERLWVRETFTPIGSMRPAGYWTNPVWIGRDYFYAADNNRPTWGSKWIPSIHMPRKASRLTLDITKVRVEQLHDITEEDAIAAVRGIRSHRSGPCARLRVHRPAGRREPHSRSQLWLTSAASSFN